MTNRTQLIYGPPGAATATAAADRAEAAAAVMGVSPLSLGLVAGGSTVNSAAAFNAQLLMLNKPIQWGPLPSTIYAFDAPINITRPNQSWQGAATLRLVKASGSAVCPLVILQKTATDFYGSPQITYDHNAANLVAPVLANQIAFVYGCCFLAMAPRFNIGGRFYNTWDNALGICEVAFTGAGTVGSPLSAVQTLASPQGWVTTEIYGENCGCGVHGGQFGENGKKGAVVNVLTAADGVVGPVTGKSNYNGLIVDFGGSAEGTVLGAHFYGTIADSAFPSNGSGIDYWFGSGKINVGPIQSHNAGRYGVAVPEYAGEVTFSSAMVHASQQQGVVVNGGRISGTFAISDCGLAANNTYAAFDVEAVENADLNINVIAFSASTNPNKHSFGYQSSAASGRVVRGQVRIHSVGHGTSSTSPAADRSTLENLFVSDATPGVEMFGPLAVGTQSLSADANSDLRLGRDLSIGANSGLFFNGYFNNATSNNRFLTNGWMHSVRSNNTTGRLEIVRSTTQNAGGADAVATPVLCAEFGPSSSGVGFTPRANQQQSLSVSSLAVGGASPSVTFNAVFNTATSNWESMGAGAESFLRQETDALRLYTDATNATAAGQTMTPVARVTFTQDGRVGIGTTPSGASGVRLHVNGTTLINTDGTSPNVLDLRGGVAQNITRYFNNDGTSEWARVTAEDGVWRVGISAAVIALRVTTGSVAPGGDNAITLGSASLRWSTVFAATGTINTSDAREKTPVRAFSKAEKACAREIKATIGVFQWLASVETKGDDARLHVGTTVQKVIEIFEKNGLDPWAYGMICKDDITKTVTSEDGTETQEPDGHRLGLRTDQLTLFILANM